MTGATGMAKALDEKVEKDPHFWKPVTPREVDRRDHDWLGVTDPL